MSIYLALRNLVLLRKRYALIIGAIALGFAIACVISGVSHGMLEAMKRKAARYFPGQVGITMYNYGLTIPIGDADELIERIRAFPGMGEARVSKRTIYYRSDAELYFGGDSIRQRRIAGIDPSDAEDFRGMEFVAGGIEGVRDDRGILISESAARLLGARLGDDVNVLAIADDASPNAMGLIVRGIFRESSIFGYISYMNRRTLNSLLGRDPESVGDLALHFPYPLDSRAKADEIRQALERSGIPVLPRSDTKEALYEVLYGEGGARLSVMGVDAHLSQFADIIEAVNIVSSAILALFIGILAAGILNTYRMIAIERRAEIGTMRAMGMQKPRVIALFACEGLGLSIAGAAGGLGLGALALAAASMIDLSRLQGAGLFIEGGRIAPSLGLGAVMANFAILACACVAAVLGPAMRAAKVPPADAIRGER